MRRIHKSVLSVVAIALSGEAMAATPKDEFKQLAGSGLQEMVASGEPKSRCALNALFVDDGLVVRTVGSTPLTPGDRVRSINGVAVAGKPYAELRRVLSGVPSTASVALEIDRRGESQVFEARCTDSLSAQTKLRDALAAASKGKFDDCLATLGSHEELGTSYWMLRLNCAAFSRSGRGQYDPENLYRWLLSTAEDVRWQPDAQKTFLEMLHKAEPTFASAGRTDLHSKIVDVTRTWPNAKADTYASTTPNWARFRRKAEEAIRARLVDPSSAQFTWTYGFLYGTWKPAFQKRINGYWTCGLVNARNRMGGFAGTTSFVVVMPDENTVTYADVGSGNDVDIVAVQCQKSVKLLPPAPPELLAAEALPLGAMSVADEIQKLAELRDKGIITQQEFEAQKAKLLGK